MSMRSNLKSAFLCVDSDMFMKNDKGLEICLDYFFFSMNVLCKQRILFTLIIVYLVPDLLVVIIISENKHLF